jgi:membrane associated rhomboid family serine protease
MKPEVKNIISSFIPGTLFIGILSLIKYYEVSQQVSFSTYGVFPRSLDAITGILTFPLIHKDYDHLFSNAVPLFVLMGMLNYFYKDMAGKVFFFLWLIGGVWLWIGGRPSFHIGASGLVYGLASFIFFSGIWRKWRSMLAVSMIVVFLYGSMIWGIFPWFKETSWEGHLFGGLAGLLLSWLYRKEGPQRPKFVWEDEIEDNKIYDEEGNEIDLKMVDNLKMDQFENLKMGDNLKMDQFENLKMGDDIPSSEKDRLFGEASLKMDEETLNIDPSPKIQYTYVENDQKRNADDTDENILH